MLPFRRNQSICEHLSGKGQQGQSVPRRWAIEFMAW